MEPVDARALLDCLLSGGDLEAQHIERLLAHLTPEGLHLEYKGWDFVEGKAAAAKVRKWVAGFANSDGGVLLIGFHENRNEGELLSVSLDGKPASPRAKGPGEWAARALTDIAPMLSPAAHIKAIEHDGRPVLAIAVARAPNAVWCAEERRMAYYLRIGDQTLTAPDYLHADIVTGRRVRPVFDVLGLSVSNAHAQSRISCRWNLHITLSNTGLVWVDEGIIGMLGYGVETDSWAPARQGLLAYVDDRGPPPDHWLQPVGLLSKRENLAPFVPLTQREERFTVEFAIPTSPYGPYRWQGVLYVLPRDCPPTFWQVELAGSTEYDSRPHVQYSKLHDGAAGIVRLGAP